MKGLEIQAGKLAEVFLGCFVICLCGFDLILEKTKASLLSIRKYSGLEGCEASLIAVKMDAFILTRFLGVLRCLILSVASIVAAPNVFLPVIKRVTVAVVDWVIRESKDFAMHKNGLRVTLGIEKTASFHNAPRVLGQFFKIFVIYNRNEARILPAV